MANTATSRPRVERLEREAIDAAMTRIRTVARLMDALVAIPGTSVRIGFDAILGLVPGIGDLIAQAIATYIIWEARQLGVSKVTLARMFANTLVDTVFGIVPVAGDVFDVAFRANMKNLRLLERHLEKHGYQTAAKGGATTIEGDWRRVA